MTQRETGGWWRSPSVGAAIVAFALASCGDDTATTATTTAAAPGTIATTAVSAPDASTATTAVTITSNGATPRRGNHRGGREVRVRGLRDTRRRRDHPPRGFGLRRNRTVLGDERQLHGRVHHRPGWPVGSPGGRPWAVLAGPAPVVDPLTPLTHPSAVTVVSSDGDDAVLEATFAAAVLGFSGNEDVVVTLTIVDGVLAEIRYTTPAGNRRSGGRHDIDTNSVITPITCRRPEPESTKQVRPPPDIPAVASPVYLDEPENPIPGVS